MDEIAIRSRNRSRAALPILGVVLLFFIVLAVLSAAGPPEIKIEPGTPVIGKRTSFKIQVSEPRRGLQHVKVEFYQGNKTVTLLEKNYTPSSQFFLWGPKTSVDNFTIHAGRQVLPSLTGGSAAIRVTADRAGTWLRHPDPVIEEIQLPVRLTPPALQVVSTHVYVAQGGCEAVAYRVGEASIRDGVRAGSWWFPGYPFPGGGKQDRFALFAAPYDMEQPDVRLVAEDGAGNEAEAAFIDKFFPKRFVSDNLRITDEFLRKVVPEIMAQSPELKDRGNLLDNYLAINRDLRRKNDEILKNLARKSTPLFLWGKPFLRLPNGKTTASFGDKRSYLYENRVVDHQIHLGCDLASVKQAPIPAANDGIVSYQGFLGIYGNSVVIDHGYGLMTIYGHLSSIAVSDGEKVARGDIIGRTGDTGLAGGDHLHFGMLLQGLPVNPVEWWDGHWIQDRIAKKLGPAFP